ncbi:MAG: hypothetical protein Tsb004_23650 [Allomuricauda sp.]|jgi:hypothetical protein
MKHLKNLLLAVLALNLVVSCSEDDDSNGSVNFSSADAIALTDSVNNGTWRVTLFIDDDENETSDYNGAEFTFNSDGTIDVEMGMNTFSGTWSIELDDDDDDDDLDELEFDISFSNSNNFDDLSDDWYVIEYSNNRIRLSEDDDDDDDDDDDLLTFERIQ